MTDLKAEIKTIYNEFLHSEDGKRCLVKSIALQKDWNARCAMGLNSLTTDGVKLNKFPKKIRDRITLVDVLPFCLNNMCHANTEFIASRSAYERRFGYNVSACRCGKFISLEIHSLNRKDGVYYDFTKDFNNEKQKYFLDIEMEMDAHTFISVFGKENVWLNHGCKCFSTFPTNKWTTNDDLQQLIDDMEDITLVDC